MVLISKTEGINTDKIKSSRGLAPWTTITPAINTAGYDGGNKKTTT